MNISEELEKSLLEEVGLLLSEHGFNAKPIGQSFRMNRSHGWASIHLGFVRHPPTDFDVIVDVAIRVNAVQDIIQEDDPLLTSADRKKSATIGCELGNIEGKGQQRWTVKTENDIKHVAMHIVADCKSTALPFIDRYSDLNTLLEVLTSDEKTARLISPIEAKRVKTIDALSTLLKA